MGKIKEVFKIADTVIDLPKPPTNLKGNVFTQIKDAITNVFKKRTKFKEGTQEYNAALDKIADQAQELANKIRPPKKPPF